METSFLLQSFRDLKGLSKTPRTPFSQDIKQNEVRHLLKIQQSRYGLDEQTLQNPLAPIGDLFHDQDGNCTAVPEPEVPLLAKLSSSVPYNRLV